MTSRWELFTFHELAVIHSALVQAPVGQMSPDLYRLHVELLNELVGEFDRRNDTFGVKRA